MENKQERINEIDALIKAEIQKGCYACRGIGVWHCAHPEDCGQWDEVIKLENEKNNLQLTH